ncbi:hypothetical protein [Frondihabitans australicus]|uniref:Uncharacterized protein n=1 Tax=Frondihabitans australicus TaxID=386892 RepID=A0A495IGM1_9MICO|nr:hypothetical protein [Frondihabitans australicus]RKR74810.1 hypothetical protein C8E83_1941 [Frondihabitans australicus]
MTLHRAENASSPFSEIRQLERDRTLMVIAASTLAATGFVIAGVFVALGLV